MRPLMADADAYVSALPPEQQRVVAEVLSQVLVPLDLARENLSGDAAHAAKAGDEAAEKAAKQK